MPTSAQIQRIYAMGAILGILESGNQNDMLHSLVSGITGKEHISALTPTEYKAVVSELATRIQVSQLKAPSPKPKRTARYEQTPGGMTAGQQKKVWYLMYQLSGCDKQPCTSSLGTRLSGIIKKEIGVDASPKKPMDWLSYKQGAKLIEIIKKYCRTAESKAMRGG